jgi:trehalose/maltose hydrolase-like predicted phosphorylase
MSTPLSPPPVTSGGQGDLPAYVSNGLIGLRIVEIPLISGVALLNGYVGLHPNARVEAAARAPYPLAGDIGIGGVWLRSSPHQARFIAQAYDFATAELTTRFAFDADGVSADVEVVSFCSRERPTIVLQEVTVRVDRACKLVLRAIIDPADVHGRMTERLTEIPGEEDALVDGAMAWESLGGLTRCGIAYATELVGEPAEEEPRDGGRESPLVAGYRVDARPGRPYRLRQIVSLVPGVMHHQPEAEAIRHASWAAKDGFEALCKENRQRWGDLWKGRILITADDERWQRLADAAFFYLNGSVHPSAPCSTSIYGLAQWNDYHYYYGHVMWDVETFTVPPLLLSQPDAARALLEYRSQTVTAARGNAKLNGRRGLQFPWESGPLHGEEAAPGMGSASWHEDHVSLDVAVAFARYAHATGDDGFLVDDAAGVLFGVADWITSRVSRRRGGFDFRRCMGIAERPEPSDNEAFTIMSAMAVLREAIACAERLGRQVRPAWREVLDGLSLPRHSRHGAVLSHDGFHPNEEKGATPGPLAGLFPLWHELDPETEPATLEYYLRLAPDYIGSAMLSPLYGVWAAWAGDRALSARLYDEGYARLVADRFLQTLEQAPELEPDKPDSGPFFANLGGFLMGLVFGLPGIRVGPDEPASWAVRPVVLPAGWESIEIERAWIRGRPATIVARQGAQRAAIDTGAKERTRIRLAG